jgi:hypothetical protein
MYNDFRSTGRESWKYSHKGSELISLAKRKRDEFYEKEMSARRDLAALLKDPKVGPSDKRLSDLKTEIEFSGNQREQCEVFVFEFEINKDKEYLLSLGDVVFFDLINGPGK